MDGFVAVPDDPAVQLAFAAGRLGGKSDGVHFVVRVNGREIWRELRDATRGWKEHALPLGTFAGQPVVLSLAVDCGPSQHHRSCDESIWADVRFTTLCPD